MFLLELGARIAIIVSVSILGVWLLALVVDLIFIGSFSSIFKKHRRSIPVILYTKYENLKAIISILNQSGVKVDNRYMALLNDIGPNDFNEPGSELFDKSKNTLSYLKDELFFAASAHPELDGDEEFAQAKRNINDADTQYRNTVMMYNADVLGYNYWIRFFPWRFLFKLLKVKKKEIIS